MVTISRTTASITLYRFLFLCAVSLPLLCVAAPLLASTTAAQRPGIAIATLAQAPTIDGDIDPKEWSGAAVLDQHLVQIDPEEGEASPFRTVIRIAQTGSALYVAFEAYDPEPSRLAAAVTNRDGKLDDDDSVAVMLDTFLDHRTAYLFQVNALATQLDGRIADNGRTIDLLWDEAWTSATKRLADRFTVELEIPFEILRFQPGSDRSWGISFMRTVPRRLETSLWPAPTETRFRVANFGTLSGLELGQPLAKKWQLIPYALAVYGEDSGEDFEIGGDLRFRPSSTLTIDLTANPDFALIEADVEEINLTRFELFVPEKRTFFLEGSEMFRQRIRQFHSRRIGDITGGGKAIGTLGKTSYSAVVASEDRDLLATNSSARADYGVVRLQHSLPRGSTLGLLAANRRFEGEDQGSVGLDTTLFFTKTLGLTAQLMQAHGIAVDDGLAWFVRPAYDSNTTHFHVRYTNLDRGILDDINAIGFLRDDDRKEWDTNLTRTFWIGSGAVEKIEAGFNYNRYNSQVDVLRSWELDAGVELVFRNKWEAELVYIDEFQRFAMDFRNERIETRVGWNGRNGRSIFGTVADGENFGSDLRLYGAEAEWKVSDRFGFAYSVTRLELEPDPGNETTWIHVLETVFSFNPDNFVKLFAQTNEAIDKVNVQALWVWRFIPPFGSLQVAFQTGTSDLGQVSTQGDTLFTKLSWVF